MESLRAKATSSLKVESLQTDDVAIEKIKKLRHAPLRDFGPDDVYVRRMWLTGDKLNSRFGQFRTRDLPHVAALSIDAPVMVGHQIETMPIGRIFDAKLEEYADGTFVVTSFYWPRATAMGESLVSAIDFGLAGEASISFIFEKTTCGVCGGDMRDYQTCKHYPGETDEKTGKMGFYYYDGIQSIYEGSIVARGAHPDTKFGFMGALSQAREDVYSELMNKPKRKHASRRVIDMAGQVLNREVT